MPAWQAMAAVEIGDASRALASFVVRDAETAR
jgi:hypothetical protein